MMESYVALYAAETFIWPVLRNLWLQFCAEVFFWGWGVSCVFLVIIFFFFWYITCHWVVFKQLISKNFKCSIWLIRIFFTFSSNKVEDDLFYYQLNSSIMTNSTLLQSNWFSCRSYGRIWRPRKIECYCSHISVLNAVVEVHSS